MRVTTSLCEVALRCGAERDAAETATIRAAFPLEGGVYAVGGPRMVNDTMLNLQMLMSVVAKRVVPAEELRRHLAMFKAAAGADGIAQQAAD